MLRALYFRLKERWPVLAKLIFRIRGQRLKRLWVPAGVTVEGDFSAVRNIRFSISGRGNRVVIGPWTLVDDLHLVIQGSNNVIHLGEDVRVLNSVFHIEDDGSRIEVGDGSILKLMAIGMTEPNSTVKMGKDCMIAPGVDIRNGDSHAIYDGDTRQRINRAQDMIIGDRVWVGVRAMLLKGTQIADGCIVGAASVVAKPLTEARALYVGTPPRLVRSNIYWTRERD